MQVLVFPDAHHLARAAARRIATLIRSASADTVSIAMAGGGTPKATYAELLRQDVPWQRVFAWVGDERFVPPDHPDNNSAMIGDVLAQTGATYAPVPWRSEWSAADAATEYEGILEAHLNDDGSGLRPDVMLLGMGDDGHTLSLFPGTDALSVTDRWFVENWVAAKDTWRLTTTFALAHRARHILFLVSGAAKADALARVLEPPDDVTRLPAKHILNGQADVTFFVDADAAGRLDSTLTVPASP
ncbi:MAG: 6-phosphogluconolactonase [Acidimicrobiia bacterium]|nr:6-phosphogluconolactonase [Acidimicrobiia bacterium]